MIRGRFWFFSAQWKSEANPLFDMAESLIKLKPKFHFFNAEGREVMTLKSQLTGLLILFQSIIII
jgi:hypothetical protein